MVSPGMVGGQSGVLGYAVSHVVVGRAYRHAPAQTLLPMYMVTIVLAKTWWKVHAILSNVVKSLQVNVIALKSTL
jgi:hypothetical protein